MRFYPRKGIFCSNVPLEIVQSSAIEWVFVVKKVVQHAANSPDVALTVIMALVHLLRTHKVGSAHHGGCDLCVLQHFAYSEVAYFDVPSFRDNLRNGFS